VNPDVYAAFRTAGEWAARNWPNLALAALLAAFAALCIRHACHDLAAANRRINTALAEHDPSRKEERP
jgi:hypothetical protein